MKTLERQVKKMDQPESDFQEDLGTGGKLKNWLQDNIRIVISVLIVVAIAGGIYSYSKRSEQLSLEDELMQETETEEITKADSAVNVVGEEEKKDEEKNAEEVSSELTPTPVTTPASKPEPTPVKPVEEKKEEIKLNGDGAQTIVAESEETGDAFVQTAVAGDGTTKMARRALKSYLEKNNDSSLTAEHKIFIEDYLRKNINHPQKAVVGEKISFSKDLIKGAIEHSKSLDQKQLDNLKKYSARVVW